MQIGNRALSIFSNYKFALSQYATNTSLNGFVASARFSYFRRLITILDNYIVSETKTGSTD